MRSGNINLANTAGDGTLRNASAIGYVWSSRTSADSSVQAYWFEYVASASRPSRGPISRNIADSLRCLSTVLDI